MAAERVVEGLDGAEQLEPGVVASLEATRLTSSFLIVEIQLSAEGRATAAIDSSLSRYMRTASSHNSDDHSTDDPSLLTPSLGTGAEYEDINEIGATPPLRCAAIVERD